MDQGPARAFADGRCLIDLGEGGAESGFLPTQTKCVGKDSDDHTTSEIRTQFTSTPHTAVR